MALDSSSLIPISNVIDTSLIKNLEPGSQEFKEFMISLIDNVNSILLAVNAKSIGMYSDKETLTGNTYYDPDHQVTLPSYGRLIICGALKNAPGTTNIAHGLDNTWDYKFVKVIGMASDPTNKVYLPIPYATSTAADIIELDIDANNINITVGKDRSTFTDTRVYLEYIE